MKVIFDPQIFSLQKYGGISRYFAELSSNMYRLQLSDVHIHCPNYACQYLRDVPTEIFKDGIDVSTEFSSRHRRLYYAAKNLRSFGQEISHTKYDIVHHTYYLPMSNALRAKARVTTIHDMIDEGEAVFNIRSLFKYRSIKQADHVICVSEYTRQMVLRLCDVSPCKLSVVHLGKPVVNTEFAAPRLHGRPYILYVGLRTGYKNFSRFLAAYVSQDRIRNDFRVVCFGGGPFTLREIDSFHQFGLDEQDVSHIDGSDAMLHAAYRGAHLFVYPSVQEGFGLPPLEAMSLGTPVACSNTTSIPEVVGSAGAYFDPTIVDAIVQTLQTVLYSDTLRGKLIASGYQQADKFSWRRCASETHDVYRKMA
jgi:glycosyltransferase involved in cell wall biosynthesis